MRQNLIKKEGLCHDANIRIEYAYMWNADTVFFGVNTTPRMEGNHSLANYQKRQRIFGKDRYPDPTLKRPDWACRK